MKLAVIDLGTNTSNLLIAEVIKPGYRILHQSKQLVRLGDNKIRNNLLSKEAITRAYNALAEQKKIIENSRFRKFVFLQPRPFAMPETK
jgi:exopolyphosphatase / guanosine-5'-triphosphate,3'-diphosphate pyrophosphatase